MSLPRLSASLIVTAPLLATATTSASASASAAAYNYRVLMVKRASTGSFESAYVFPGGVQESQDTGPLACALRETHEETGLLLANSPASNQLQQPGCTQIGRWITPRAQKKRFDTRFFLLNVADDQALAAQLASAKPQPGELVGLDWFRPDQALEMNRRAELALFPPQFYVFHELSRFRRWQDLVAHGASICAGDADRVEPVLCKRSDGAVVGLLPGDAAYGFVEKAQAADDSALHVDDADLFCTPDTHKHRQGSEQPRLHRLVMKRAPSGGFHDIRLLKTAVTSGSKL